MKLNYGLGVQYVMSDGDAITKQFAILYQYFCLMKT